VKVLQHAGPIFGQVSRRQEVDFFLRALGQLVDLTGTSLTLQSHKPHFFSPTDTFLIPQFFSHPCVPVVMGGTIKYIPPRLGCQKEAVKLPGFGGIWVGQHALFFCGIISRKLNIILYNRNMTNSCLFYCKR